MRQNRQYIRTNEGVISYFNDRNALDALALYYLIRGKFKKSPVLYDFSWRSASNKLGVSITQLRRCVPLMIKWKLAHYHKGNLQLVAHNKVEKPINGKVHRHRCTIDTQRKNITTIGEMKKLLLLKLVEFKARQINYMNSHLENELSYRVTQVNRENQDEIKGAYVGMSVSLIAKTLNIGKTTAHSLLEWWTRNKYISRIKGLKRAAQVKRETKIDNVRACKAARKVVTDIMKEKFGYGYWWRNLYITVEPDFLAMLSFPLQKSKVRPR